MDEVPVPKKRSSFPSLKAKFFSSKETSQRPVENSENRPAMQYRSKRLIAEYVRNKIIYMK